MNLGASMKELFGHPRGKAGYLVALIMALENRDRNRWVVEQLDIHDDHCVLEVGCGPGVAIARAARFTTQGRVVGVDFSNEALEVARWLNLGVIRAGRVTLQNADAAALSFPNDSFDRVFTVNSFHHWSEPDAGLRELHRVLRPGGTLGVAEQPRHRLAIGAEKEFAKPVVDKLRTLNLIQVHTLQLEMSPAPTFLTLGTK